MINIPNKEQWEMMNEHLSNIAEALDSQIDVSTWSGVQKAVRTGIAPELFPIGSSFVVEHTTYGQLQFDVVAHDHFKNAYDSDSHTMTLMCHTSLPRIQFDRPEAFYQHTDTAEGAAGTYNFTIPSYNQWSGTYQFTTQNPILQNYQFCLSGYANVAPETLSVQVYDGDTLIESCPITVGSAGISLGTFGTELNHAHRVSYGSDNYRESAIRQFLNSDGEVGKAWVRQTQYDRPPEWVGNTAGFLNGLDSGFLSVVGRVTIPCVANNVYEAPDSATKVGEAYVLKDKFYLASAKEVFGASSGVPEDGSEQFPFFEGASDSDRIKYLNTTAVIWGLRSPNPGNAFGGSDVTETGTLANPSATTKLGVVPVCNIV